MTDLETVVDLLENAGLLTRRQAEAYLRCSVGDEQVMDVATEMGISPPTLSESKQDAEQKVRSARKTVEILEKWDEQRE